MKKFLYSGSFFLIAVLICACFSPWQGDEGNLSIVWGNSGNSRWVNDLDDINVFKVILKGPGGTIEEEFNGIPGANFSVIPGTWSVTVKGGKYDPPMPDFFLEVMGIEQVEVKAGEKSSEKINMYTVFEVYDWSTLNADMAANNGSYNIAYPGAPPPPRTEILLIKNNLKADSPINIIRPIIIVAEKPVTIRRNPGFDYDSFFNVSGTDPKLSLGCPGMTGTITLDGAGVNPSLSLGPSVVNLSNGNFVLWNGVTIRNNKSSYGGGGVSITSGTFTMNGGNINDNTVLEHNGDSYGGGVFMTGGIFNMNGGNINGNIIEGAGGLSQGGGVYVGGGTFTMSGGTISGNIVKGSNALGGGVYVGGGAFTQPYKGTISGNSPDQVKP